MNPNDKVMTKLLTSYRAIPLMYRALQEEGPIRMLAREELSRILPVPSTDVVSFIEPYKSRIAYAMQDFHHYSHLIESVPSFKETYWKSMSEEAELIKLGTGFKIPFEHPTILDVGAGEMPYLPMFQCENSQITEYIAVDKGYTDDYKPPSVGIPITCIKDDLFGLRDRHLDYSQRPDVLFLANFLHCLEDIDAFFTHILPCLPNLKLIKVLEVKPDCNLDYLFGYHMYEHCKGQRVGVFDVADIARSMDKEASIDSLGDYHLMYTIEL